MTVAAVDRSIAVIELLAGEAAALELSEIAQRVGLPASAAHRILATLIARGWVVQDEASQNYALSLRLGMLAFRSLDLRHLPDAALAALRRLAANTQEYCRLAVVEGDGLTWISRAQGAVRGLRYEPNMGEELVLHATANGKAWLSTLPEDRALRLVLAEGLGARPNMGPNYLRDIDTFRQHLARARIEGYASAVDEAEAGTTALAVPFHASDSPGSAVAGTISVAGPTLRIRPARYAEIARELRETAREISQVWPVRIRQRDFPAVAAAGKDRAV